MARYLYVLTYSPEGSEEPETYTLLAERNDLTRAELWWEFCRDNYADPDEHHFARVRAWKVVDLHVYGLERLIAQNADPRDPNPPRFVQEAIAAERKGQQRAQRRQLRRGQG